MQVTQTQAAVGKGQALRCLPLTPALPNRHCIQPFNAISARIGSADHSCRRPRLTVHATSEGQVEESAAVQVGNQPETATSSDNGSNNNWIAVCRPEDLPKGTRKEMDVDDRQVLLFWYRNQIYCIEARSPAEGAYSEGFIKAKFTQDYAIECPATKSLFSLKDGSIVSWYPNNPVLAALTPSSTCRPLEIYPVKLAQEAIYIDVNQGTLGGVKSSRVKGGSDTSLENNNVFSVQPTVYFEGMDPSKESASERQGGPRQGLDPVIVGTGVLALGMVAVAGTAICIYYEDVYLLGAFWTALGGATFVAAFNYIKRTRPLEGP